MRCFNKRADAESIANEAAMIRIVEQRAPGVVLPYCRGVNASNKKIEILEYPINLTLALRTGRVDPCGSVIVSIVKKIKEMCEKLYEIGVVHYDLHTSNIVLKFLSNDLSCMPDVRFIDWVLSCDYTAEKRPPHVRKMPIPDAHYDWYFFCFSFIQLYKVLSIDVPAPILDIKNEVVVYSEQKNADGHEWSRVN